MGAQASEERESSLQNDHLQKTKTLICAVNLLSRNLPLPPQLFDSVSSIYAAADGDSDGGSGSAAVDNVEIGSDFSSEGNLLTDLEDALSKQRANSLSGDGLTKLKEKRLQSNIQHRITELEGEEEFKHF